MTWHPSLVAILLLASLTAEDVPLAQRLESTDDQVVMQALFELGKRGPPGTHREIEVVRMRLRDPDVNLRTAAASTAACLHDDGAVPQLIAAMREAGEADAEAFHSALRTLAGGDLGGDDPDRWSTWHEGVIASTRASCARIRLALQDDKPEIVRASLHPLLMQRAGRDLIVELLAELSKGKDPRLVALAREGLASIDTAAAGIVLTDLIDSLPEGAVTSAAVATAVAEEVSGSDTPSQPITGPIQATVADPGTSTFSWAFFLLITLSLAVCGWLAGRHWLDGRKAAAKATGPFKRREADSPSPR